MKRCLDVLIVTVLALSLIGCSKEKEEKTTIQTEPTGTGVEKTIKGATDAAAKAVDDVTKQAEQVTDKAGAAVADVKTQVADATSRFDKIVAAIKANLDANAFDKAALGLKEGFALQGLSGEQKGILQRLQELIQKALLKNTVGDATKNVGGVTGDAAKTVEGGADAAKKKVGGLLKGFGTK